MYGGYGNLWNQAASGGQWQTPAQNQSQMPRATATQGFVNSTQAYQNAGVQQQLGNTANQNLASATAGMTNYAHLGIQTPTTNQYANFANPTMGVYGQNSAANMWGQQNFQVQQQVLMASKNLLAFPGGRPPLPPGPPPPDKPKETVLKPTIPTALAKVVTPQNQPPPPPPPPPSKQLVSSTQSTDVMASMLPKLLKPEDIFNILQSASSLGFLPNNAPITPLTSLNVSEELFGSKTNSQGIPGLGLEMIENEPNESKKPEVIDLDGIPAAVTSVSTVNPKSNMAQTHQDGKEKQEGTETIKTGIEWKLKSEETDLNSSHSTTKSEAEIKWELRSDLQTDQQRTPFEWTLPGKSTESNATKPKPSSSEIPQNGSTKHDTNTKDDKNDKMAQAQKNNTERDTNPVRIPLEPADGKDLVYDRKTLKQFDQKFREWESQFENWKRANERHPNKESYKQYLDQWNLWREQLIEQRRSILDTMTKAKLDSKDILLSKLESLNKPEEGRYNDERCAPNSSKATFENSRLELEDNEPWNKTSGTNPFEVAMKRTDSSASSVSSGFTFGNASNQSFTGNVNEKVAPANDKGKSGDRPVERILRDSNDHRSDKNPFEDRFSNTSSSNDNPFMNKSVFSTGSNASSSINPPKLSSDESEIPFEWSLPSSRKNGGNNPFDIQQSNNPFIQSSASPSGPNPFDTSSQQRRLPSLMDFLPQSNNQNFTVSQSQSGSFQSANPFIVNSGVSDFSRTPMRQSSSVERISRDPQGNQQQQQQQPKANIIITPPTTIRLEANPVGMPLLKAAAIPEEEKIKEVDEYSHLFSRDRGPVENSSSNIRYDDDDFADADVVDYAGVGAENAEENSNDSMDLPRGEKANTDNVENEEGDDEDYSFDDAEVIDYKDNMAMQQISDHHPPGEMYEGEYPESYEQDFPPQYYMTNYRGRGRGFPFPRGRARFGGPVPFGYLGGPPFPHPMAFGPRPFRGRGPPPFEGFPYPHPHVAPNWYQHDDREPVADASFQPSPEVINLSPSPPPDPTPGPRIAPRNPEFEEGRRRSVSGDRDRSRRRSSRDRSRSRSRDKGERVSRRNASPSDRRSRTSRYDKDKSPDSRRRYDDRRERDRYRQHGDRGRRSTSRSRSRTPPRERNSKDTVTGVVRNPLFPSASSIGMMTSSNPIPPRHQKILVEDILNKPGRSKRPPRIVIIMRGLPGSGKSHIVKLIKEREVENGGKAPRILSLDNYFTTEIERKEKDPISGAEVKKTVMEYEYDEEREPLYRAQLIKQFRKTLDEGYFSFVIVDGVNDHTRQFEEMATFATQKRFQVYVAEIEESVDVCTKRNVHKRTRDEILKLQRKWERTPSHLIKLDTRTLLQDELVDDDVEMEDVSDVETDAKIEKSAPTPAERGKVGPQVVGLEEIDDDDSGDHLLVSNVKSKWDTIEQSQEKLNKLDGLKKKRGSAHETSDVSNASSIEMWLTSNMPEDYVSRRQTRPDEKRVRWADIEERREQERMKEIGFVVGHTDWKRMMDPTFGSSALTKTKFF